MSQKSCHFGLGVAHKDGIIRIFYNSLDGKGTFSIDESKDGASFSPVQGKPTLTAATGEEIATSQLKDFRMSTIGANFFLTFRMTTPIGMRTYAVFSPDGINWRSGSEMVVRIDNMEPHPVTEPAAVVPGYTFGGKRVMYYGATTIKTAVSEDGKFWYGVDGPVLSPRLDKFDNGPLMIASAEILDRGILVIYYARTVCESADCWSVGTALFDRKDPAKLISRSEEPVLEHIEGFQGKTICPVGVVLKGTTLLTYWDVEDEGIVMVSHPLKGHAGVSEGKKIKLVLEKLVHNPILKPIAKHLWESKAVFNPAAIYDHGKVHLIYRACGDNDVSVLGYATSSDGVTIDERLSEPIYVPRKPFELSPADNGSGYTSPYFSGGAYGGCEDPRITKIGNTYFMMYVAFNGVQGPRVALTSIAEDDFVNRRWDQWKEPVLVSKPGVVDKNACLLPEKINGKYVVFHRIFPNILVDYVDELEFDGETKYLKGEYMIPPRYNGWDSRKLGVGATPIKTEAGWLLIYQAVDERDASRYKVGAMLLDLKEPHKVLYRSKKPILEPDRHYENEGLKFGVAYPCGAVIMNDMLNVYYGGADTVVCAAQAPAKEFISRLASDDEITLTPIMVKAR